MAQLADRLADRFPVAAKLGSGAVVERHQTLRATVEWSYRLLKGDEQVLFDRLSVFVGSFDLDAVETVCTVHPLDTLEVEELLGALVDKSLVTLQRRPEAVRYRLLETLREYGNDRLAARGERERLLDAHMAHFVEMAERVVGSLRRRRVCRGRSMVSANWDDLRAALIWAVQLGDHERGARLVEAATMFGAFWFRFELADWAERVIALLLPVRPCSARRRSSPPSAVSRSTVLNLPTGALRHRHREERPGQRCSAGRPGSVCRRWVRDSG